MPEDAGALLVRSGLVSNDQLRLSRQAHAGQGGTIGEHLVLAGFVDDETLAEFYRIHLMVPQVRPEELHGLNRTLLDKIPAAMAMEFRCLPIACDRERNLTLAMADPSTTHAVDEISFFTGDYIIRAVATQRQIAWCLARYYHQITLLGKQMMDEANVLIAEELPFPQIMSRIAHRRGGRTSGTPAIGVEAGTSPTRGRYPTRPLPLSPNKLLKPGPRTPEPEDHPAGRIVSHVVKRSPSESGHLDSNRRAGITTRPGTGDGAPSRAITPFAPERSDGDAQSIPAPVADGRSNGRGPSDLGRGHVGSRAETPTTGTPLGGAPSNRASSDDASSDDASSDNASFNDASPSRTGTPVGTLPDNPTRTRADSAPSPDDSNSVSETGDTNQSAGLADSNAALPSDAATETRDADAEGGSELSDPALSIPEVIESDRPSPPPYLPPSEQQSRAISFLHEETPPTGPMRIIKRSRSKVVPELEDRAGEFEVISQKLPLVDESLPAVVIETLDPESAGIRSKTPSVSVAELAQEANNQPLVNAYGDTAPIPVGQTDQARNPTPPAGVDSDMDTGTGSSPERRRPHRQTRLGLGIEPSRLHRLTSGRSFAEDGEDYHGEAPAPPYHGPPEDRGDGDGHGDREAPSSPPGLPSGVISRAQRDVFSGISRFGVVASYSDEEPTADHPLTDGNAQNHADTDTDTDTDTAAQTAASAAHGSPERPKSDADDSAAADASVTPAEGDADGPTQPSSRPDIGLDIEDMGGVPEPVATFTDYEEADEEAQWGPPGSTIPPRYLVPAVDDQSEPNQTPAPLLAAHLEGAEDAGPIEHLPKSNASEPLTPPPHEASAPDFAETDLAATDPTEAPNTPTSPVASPIESVDPIDTSDIPVMSHMPVMSDIPDDPAEDDPEYNILTDSVLGNDPIVSAHLPLDDSLDHDEIEALLNATDELIQSSESDISGGVLSRVANDQSGPDGQRNSFPHAFSEGPSTADGIPNAVDLPDTSEQFDEFGEFGEFGATTADADDGNTDDIPINESEPIRPVRAASSPAQPFSESVSDFLPFHTDEPPSPDVVNAFEESSLQLVEILRNLDQAEDRNEVIDTLIRHLSQSHMRVAFFVVRSRDLSTWKQRIGDGPIERRDGIKLSLDEASTFQDIVGTRLPYRGTLTDPVSRTFVAAALGYSAGDMLALPVSVRGRVVGVLYGDTSTKRVFAQHLAVVTRAVGVALERILRAQKTG